MRPVNLIPEETRRNQVRSKTGPAPYLVIAVLGFAVIGSGAYVWLSNQVTDKQGQLTELTAQAARATEKAKTLAPYGKFAALKRERVAAVQSIVDSRFPWAGVLLDVARAMPSDAWLVQATGKVSPGAQTGAKSASGGSATGGSSAAGGADINVPGPTIKLIGCTYRQAEVARLMTRLRNIDGVAQVLLSESEEADGQSAAKQGGASTSTDECRTRPTIHKFTVTITFPPGKATQLAGAIAVGGKSASPSAAPPPSGSGSGSQGSGSAQPVSGSSP